MSPCVSVLALSSLRYLYGPMAFVSVLSFVVRMSSWMFVVSSVVRMSSSMFCGMSRWVVVVVVGAVSLYTVVVFVVVFASSVMAVFVVALSVRLSWLVNGVGLVIGRTSSVSPVVSTVVVCVVSLNVMISPSSGRVSSSNDVVWVP